MGAEWCWDARASVVFEELKGGVVYEGCSSVV